jgi:hypothetical protein
MKNGLSWGFLDKKLFWYVFLGKVCFNEIRFCILWDSFGFCVGGVGDFECLLDFSLRLIKFNEN